MKTYKLENLTCAHCAATIEESLQKLPTVKEVRLQFATLDLHLDTSDLAAVRRTIESIEPGVRVVEPEAPAAESEAGEPWWPLALGTAVLAGLLVAQNFLGASAWFTGTFAVLYVATGWPVLRAALRNARAGRWFDENFLMALATLAAWVVGAGAEAASVMVFYQWGEWFQDRAVAGSRRSLGALLASRPRTARRLVNGVAEDVNPDALDAGELVEVRAGEQVPADAEVVTGQGSVDTAALTGESLPRGVGPGDEVLAGSINGGSVLVLRVTKPFAESVWAGVVASVDQALARKAPLEKFITRFARWYTPGVLVGALVLFGLLTALGLPWHDSLYRALVLLVISCPCALLVSVPLTYLGAIGAGSKQGLLVRDAGALDRLARVNAAAFDKTGTLTAGRPVVSALVAVGSEADLRTTLDAGLAASTHPLARAWPNAGVAPADAREVRGQGVAWTNPEGRFAVGRAAFLRAEGFAGVPAAADTATVIHAAGPEGYRGRVEFDDPTKPDTAQALAELRRLGVGPLAVLSGDTPAVVDQKARDWPVDTARGGLLPDQKLAFVEAWELEGKRVLFVGDGLNDAPVMARATVGVSLGAGASAAAVQTADVAVLDASPTQAARLVRLGRKTRALVWQNIGLALGLKALFMVLGGLGLAGLWEAVFADVGVALLAVLNAMRAGRID